MVAKNEEVLHRRATAVVTIGQGVVQNVAGAVWFLGMGSLLRRHRPALGAAAMAVGAFLVVNAAGIMVDVEALRFIGLTGNVLLAPAWAIGMGISLLRSP